MAKTIAEEIAELQQKINQTQMILDDDIYEKSTIAKHYDGKCVFVTGGAGFLGQVFIEKLLRIGVKSIYLLMRSKKNLSPAERIAKMCSGPLYQRLRAKDEHFIDRIKLINGDLEQLQVGIAVNDLQTLYKEVDIVIHAAADVRFNIPLLDLVRSNVRGTRELLEIAKKMHHLETFVYISTAYSHCPRDVIEEKFYDAPMDPDFWLKMYDHCTSNGNMEIIEVLEPHIMAPWPNSYTYTKALTEQMVKNYSAHFPTVVIRPSIIVSTYQDPIPGWTNNITGINGLCVGIGVGFLRHLQVNKDFLIDIICADFVINTTLATIWVVAEKYNASNPKQVPLPEVYHVTSKGFYLTSERLGNDSIKLRKSEQLHSSKCIYYPVITFTHYEWQDAVSTILLQAIPAFLMDFFNTEKIRLLAITRKVKSMKNVMTFFMNKRIYFDHTNVAKVYNQMSDVDKKLFPSDSRNFDWSKFIYPYLAGLRVYVLDDPLDTWEQSKRKLRRLKYIHYSLKYSLVGIFIIWLPYLFLLKHLFNFLVDTL